MREYCTGCIFQSYPVKSGMPCQDCEVLVENGPDNWCPKDAVFVRDEEE